MKRTWFKIGLANLCLGLLITSISWIGLRAGADPLSDISNTVADGLNICKVALFTGLALSISSICCFAISGTHRK